jgi:hypothetical protein
VNDSPIAVSSAAHVIRSSSPTQPMTTTPGVSRPTSTRSGDLVAKLHLAIDVNPARLLELPRFYAAETTPSTVAVIDRGPSAKAVSAARGVGPRRTVDGPGPTRSGWL